jgi:hypothetical protein
VVSFSQVSHQRPECTSLVPIPATCNVHPVLLDWSPAQYLVRSTDHETPHYAVGYSPSYLIPYRPKYRPQHPVLKQPPPLLLRQCGIPSFTPILTKQLAPRTRVVPGKLTVLQHSRNPPSPPSLRNPNIQHRIHKRRSHVPVLSYKVSVQDRGLVQYFVTLYVLHDAVLLAPRLTRKLEDHPLSSVRDCLFLYSTVHNEGRSPNVPTPT